MKEPIKPQQPATLTPIETLLDDPQILDAFAAVYRIFEAAYKRQQANESTNTSPLRENQP